MTNDRLPTNFEWFDRRFVALPSVASVMAFSFALSIAVFAAAENPNAKRTGTVPVGADGDPLNLGFETGSLEDWTAAGNAFEGQPIRGDTVAPRRGDMQSHHAGEYWVGGFEIYNDPRRGTLTSAPFVVTHRWASFLFAGGHHATTRVELLRADTGKAFFRASGRQSENLRPVLVDLEKHRGKKIAIRLVDDHSGGWGHVNFDDFRFHEKKPKLRVAVGSAPQRADVYLHDGLDAEAAALAMTLPDGFRLTVSAAEPDVRQPIAMAIDDRGRVWIAEAYCYPRKQPKGTGKDRILIFEDADGDGRFDSRKVFIEGLNLVSGIEVGFGGVWVGQAPELLFIPDANGDDVPDGAPRVLLDGWGYQDTHETLNSFIWGPDGWLYGYHGVFTHSRVGKPGTPDSERAPINAGIWRYHPTRHEFEVFCWGTSNPWGVDFDDLGQSFLTCCVIPHLFHCIQGARYHRQGGRHFNPFVYDDIKTIAKHRHWIGRTPHSGNNRSDAAGGGHAHCGAMIYLGDAWPDAYRGKLFMNNIHGQRLNVDVLERQGSGWVGDRQPDFLLANDRWSQFINLRYGPDGNAWLIDWYDRQACHTGRPGDHDRSNGRVFKISYGELRKARVDLARASDDELVRLQLHENDWHVRHARRLLAERAARGRLSAGVRPQLAELAFGDAPVARRLRGLWALHVTGGLTVAHVATGLSSDSEFVRAWTIQLAMEEKRPSAALLERFAAMACDDKSQVVRLYLASALGRLPVAKRAPILAGLLPHEADGGDHNLPLMYWWALEPLAAAEPRAALDLAASARVPRVLEYTVRRIGSTGGGDALELLVGALESVDEAARQLTLLRGVNEALKGRRRVAMPKRWPQAMKKLIESKDANVRSQALALAVTFDDASAKELMHAVLRERGADLGARRGALASLLAARSAAVVPTLYEILAEPAMRSDALRALATFGDARTPSRVLSVYGGLDTTGKRDAIATLASRVEWARALLDAVGRGNVPATDLGAEAIQQLRFLRDETVTEQIAKHWGFVRETDAEKAAKIARYKKLLASPGQQPADLSAGRALFARTCEQCHTLFGTGGKVAPDLTGSNRADLEYILSNVLDPSAVLAKEYMPSVWITTDGRVVTGLVKEETASALTAETANGEVILAKSDIAATQTSDFSMMPDDLLGQFEEQQVRDLIAYLAAPAQVPMLATKDNVGTLFNGRDLSGWAGDERYWSVESGEIVGTSPGIRRNEFLRSHLLLGDFRLRLQVKLTPNAGNSGIQFRSQELPHGEVKGYQADVGVGWWGKLYEEHGRALLWKKSGEEHVKLGDWNDYEIVAEGSRVRTFINGKPCVDLDDREGARRGILAFQIHSGGAMEVRFRRLEVELLGERD